jgi:Zn finger protein HypA/HybF involved in hydrogenase expression
MHELSIVCSVLDQLEELRKQQPEGTKFSKVGLRVGELAVKDTPWERLALEIEEVPRRQRCPACKEEFKAENWATECPKCGEAATVLIAGEELQIAFVEVDE